MSRALYYLLIYPIELVIEFSFSLFYQMIGSLGYSILAVSIVVSFLVLPLYRRSDLIQEEERRQQEALAPWVKHIRRTFHGDERTMMIAALYQENGYKPYYALRGSISLLLQIPFFLAAYHFLSHLALLNGASFAFIRDLGAPDGLLTVLGVSVNVLPFAMTAANLLSGAIYSRGLPLSQKLQLYGMALVFLVLLYPSPAGLVLYWTMNNLFSLGKNIFYKCVPQPGRVFAYLAAAAGLLFAAAMILRGKVYSADIGVFTALVTAVCCGPLLARAVSGRQKGDSRGMAPGRPDPILFLTVSGAFALLIGGVIPLMVIGSSPVDFVVEGSYEHPLAIVGRSMLIAAGFLLVWNGVVYYLMDRRGRSRWIKILGGLFLLALVHCFALPSGTRDLSDLLRIGSGTESPAWVHILDLVLIAAVAFVLCRAVAVPSRGLRSRLRTQDCDVVTIESRGLRLSQVACESAEDAARGAKEGILSDSFEVAQSRDGLPRSEIGGRLECAKRCAPGVTVQSMTEPLRDGIKASRGSRAQAACENAEGAAQGMAIGRRLRLGYLVLAVAMGLFCVRQIQVTDQVLLREWGDLRAEETNEIDGPVYRFSRTGKNVLVIMLDKSINRMVPYLMEADPALKEQFAGFTYYPNTMSFANHTNYGLPAVFGGYDYSVAATNARPELSLREKHDEALTMMPRIFAEAGFETTFCDPTYAGYREVPDVSVFEGIQRTRAYNLRGHFMEAYQEYGDSYREQQTHNVIGYSLYRIAPTLLRTWIHDGGWYRGVGRFGGGTGETGLLFLSSYSTLEHLAGLTEIVEGMEGTEGGEEPVRGYVNLCTNDTVHDADTLQLPDFVPSRAIDNSGYALDWPILEEAGGPMPSSGERLASYESQMAAFRRLGDWFDHLRREGVYDNTRIILASDHGHYGWSEPFFNDTVLEIGVDAQEYNPLLMVKDFGAAESAVDTAFMTNADVPSLAMEGLVEDPVNPYTGNPVNEEAKKGPQYLNTANHFNIGTNNGNVFDTSGGKWYEVTPGDLYDSANWREVERP